MQRINDRLLELIRAELGAGKNNVVPLSRSTG
jgi:hypothetical protein